MEKITPAEMERISGLSLPDLDDAWKKFDEWKREIEKKNQVNDDLAAQRLSQIEEVERVPSLEHENEQSASDGLELE